MAVERDIEKSGWDYKARENPLSSAIPSLGFDESDTYLYFGSLLGIKIMHFQSQTLAKVIGKVENTERFL